MFSRFQDVAEEEGVAHRSCSLIKTHFNHINCSKCRLTATLAAALSHPRQIYW